MTRIVPDLILHHPRPSAVKNHMPSRRPTSFEEALRFVETNGIVLESARGRVPAFADFVAGERVTRWWSHPKGRQIFALTRVAIFYICWGHWPRVEALLDRAVVLARGAGEPGRDWRRRIRTGAARSAAASSVARHAVHLRCRSGDDQAHRRRAEGRRG